MKAWLKGGLIGILWVIFYFILILVYNIKNSTLPKTIELSYLGSLFFNLLSASLVTFLVGASLGLSIGLVVDLKKGGWKKSTNFKRVATISSIVYLLIALYYLVA